MARVLINFIYNKRLDKYEIIETGPVFENQKVCVLDTERDIREPLVVPVKGVLEVVDRETYEAKHKKFRLSVVKDSLRPLETPEGTFKAWDVVEDPNGPVEVWLPKEVDISKGRILESGQLVFEETKPVEKPENEGQPKPKEKKKHQRPPEPNNKEA